MCKDYDILFLKYETEFVGSFITNLFYLEDNTEIKQILREEILRRRELAKKLYNYYEKT